MPKPSDIYAQALAAHRRLRGKIAITNKESLNRLEQLQLFYTPGVGGVAKYVAAHPKLARDYTGLNNSVAIISDGSAVLGLGNIGPLGALPVMEGKAMLFKQFAGIDAYPIVLATQKPKEIIAAVTAIAPSFGAINLEDIAAPVCFEVEEALIAQLAIPIMHDDQHGTAVVVLAGLINAVKVVKKQLDQVRVVVVGAGAAGSAIAKIITHYGQADVTVIDSKGIVSRDRTDLDKYKRQLAQVTNPRHLSGSLMDAIDQADVVIGVSGPGTIRPEHIQAMAALPIVFALANPEPEIEPLRAQAAGAAVVATGRSDFPNQINNALVFPGLFRGTLDHQVSAITDHHKLAAAEALAGLIKEPSARQIIPSLFDPKVVPTVAEAIR
ncbi:NADP-dependent malic enzyme [Candidatus Microgenomates bacterium]|nr:NADP-dependent malic enzyme [Candidatus Microgenomates bacterium]